MKHQALYQFQQPSTQPPQPQTLEDVDMGGTETTQASPRPSSADAGWKDEIVPLTRPDAEPVVEEVRRRGRRSRRRSAGFAKGRMHESMYTYSDSKDKNEEKGNGKDEHLERSSGEATQAEKMDVTDGPTHRRPTPKPTAIEDPFSDFFSQRLSLLDVDEGDETQKQKQAVQAPRSGPRQIIAAVPRLGARKQKRKSQPQPQPSKPSQFGSSSSNGSYSSSSSGGRNFDSKVIDAARDQHHCEPVQQQFPSPSSPTPTKNRALQSDSHKASDSDGNAITNVNANAEHSSDGRSTHTEDSRRDTAKKQRTSEQQKDVEMGDHEARGGHREDRGYGGGGRGRGGGGGGGGFNRKRRMEREDDDNNSYDRRPQRRRYDEPPPGTRLRRQFLAVAESPMRNPEDEVQEIAKLATDNLHDNYVKETFCDLVLMLISEQPFKIPYVAAAVLYANNSKPELTAEVLKRVAVFLQEHMNVGNWREVKLIMRFLACVQSLFSDDGVFSVLDDLFNRAVDQQSASAEDAVGLELVKIILLTIPYALASSASTAELDQKAAELLEKTDIVASTPHPVEALVDPFPVAGEQVKPMACPNVLSILQKQLQAEASSGWKLLCIPRLFGVAAAAAAAGEQNNGDATSQKHAFPAISVPSPVNPGPRQLFPELYFSVFADADIESVPPTSSVASVLIRDAIVDTINIMDYNRTATAKFLIDLDCYWAPNTFVKRATPFDKLVNVPEGRSTWKPEDMIVDAIFSQILQLPTPEHKLVYYHSVITEACKIAPAAVAPSLGRAIRFCFRNIDVMDLELGYRYMDWFAHHLSNFEFRWKWTEWIEELAASNLHPRKAFIMGTLDKEIRLSFAKRIRETLPTEYAPLISEGKLQDNPESKYTDAATPYSAQGQQLAALVRKKAGDEEIEVAIKELEALAAEQGVDDVLVPSTDAYMTAICHTGSKSLSHVLSCIERCKERLLALGPASELARRQVISSVAEYWQHHPGTAVNIVDKLLNYTIITPRDVVAWCLSDNLAAGAGLSRLEIWEMVSQTMGKVIARMHTIVKARAEPALPDDQKSVIDETLVRERQGMRDLFAQILDAVQTVADGSNDAMIERFDGGEEDLAAVRAWGERWTRVWRRRAAVEESVLGEEALAAQDKLAEELAKQEVERDAAAAAAADAAAAAAAAVKAEEVEQNSVVAAENGNGAAAAHDHDEDMDAA